MVRRSDRPTLLTSAAVHILVAIADEPRHGLAIADDIAQRTREFGIRLALGDSVKIALVGLAVGFAAALAVARILSGFLFGVTAWDPLTYAAVVALVIGVVAGASLVPVRRITRLAPADVLRCE